MHETTLRSEAPKLRTVGAARHVCEILDCFSERSALSLTEIAGAVGLRKSSVYRLLQTLLACGYIAYDAGSRRYRIGTKIAGLVDAHRATNALAAVARPVLERIRAATLETAALQVRDGEVRFCIAELPGPQPITMRLGENVTYPVRHGASGHVLRAFDADWKAQRDRAMLRRVRDRGYAASYGEIIPGAVAIYVPVADERGLVVAALGIHGPAFRLRREGVEGTAMMLRTAAEELARDLPHRP